MSFFRAQTEEESGMRGGAGEVITLSSHLHDRSSCLIKALMHNPSERGGGGMKEVEEKKTE